MPFMNVIYSLKITSRNVYGTYWHNAQRGPNNRWECLGSWTFVYSANCHMCTLVEILGKKDAGWGLAIHAICWSGNHRKFLTHKMCARQKKKKSPDFKIRERHNKNELYIKHRINRVISWNKTVTILKGPSRKIIYLPFREWYHRIGLD
jgi:hypothetical protein